VRQLKKQKDATPFLRPVDPIALNIPHYPSIIKTPMDLSTIERKVTSSNPTKPDPNPQNPRYHSAEEFISDVRLIFQNCLTFNGPDHAISAMGKRVELIFDKAIKQMPAAEVGALPLCFNLFYIGSPAQSSSCEEGCNPSSSTASCAT
jgi:bromodomain-containing factor 1